MKSYKFYKNTDNITVLGCEFRKGLLEIYKDLTLTAGIDYIIYLDPDKNDIDYIASVNRGLVSLQDCIDIYYWKNGTGIPYIIDSYSYDELEDYTSEERVEVLRKEFEEENKDTIENYYDDLDEFYDDYYKEYKDFLMSNDEEIQKGVDIYLEECFEEQFYDQFMEKYYEFLDDYKDEFEEE